MSSTAAASSQYEFSASRPLIRKPSRVRGARRAFVRYLIAICIGVAATLAWQSYGDVVKQTVATKAPELGWSPEVQQLIVAAIQQLGWTKLAEPERGAPTTVAPGTAQQASFAQAAADLAAANQSASPSPTLEQVQQIASDLVILKQAVEKLSGNQDQMAQDLAKVQTTDQEVLDKVSANKVAANKSAANRVAAFPPQTATMPTHKRPPTAPVPLPPQPLPLH